METADFYYTPLVTLSAASRVLGLSESSIRQYESEGLILLQRDSKGRRQLAVADVRRLSLLKMRLDRKQGGFDGLRRALALLPCWELLGCSIDDRNACPAFQVTTRPCWNTEGTICRLKKMNCRECKVYLDAVDELLTEKTIS